MPQIEGDLSDGKTSQQIHTVLRWSENSAIVFEGTTLPEIKFTDIDVSSRIGNTTRYLELPDGSVFETQDNAAVDHLVEHFSGSKKHNLIFTLESSRKFILITLVLVVLFGWVFIQFGIPAFSRYIAMMVPDDQIHYLGKDVLSTMDGRIFSSSALDESEQDRLLSRFSDITSDIDAENIQVVFRRSEVIGANAFALPDGTIVIMDDLVNIAGTDDEVIAVLLHEIGHVHHRHSLRIAIQSFSLATFIAIITGDVSTSSTIITGLPAVLVESGYSREMESEADEYSLDHMAQFNISPRDFASIMSKIEYSHNIDYMQCLKNDGNIQDCLKGHDAGKENKETASDSIFDYLSSHPSTAERIRQFRAYE